MYTIPHNWKSFKLVCLCVCYIYTCIHMYIYILYIYIYTGHTHTHTLSSFNWMSNRKVTLRMSKTELYTLFHCHPHCHSQYSLFSVLRDCQTIYSVFQSLEIIPLIYSYLFFPFFFLQSVLNSGMLHFQTIILAIPTTIS